MSGPHFREYHLLLDEQIDQTFAMTDLIAERVRKIGGNALRSIGHVDRTKRIADNDVEYVERQDMTAPLSDAVMGSRPEPSNTWNVTIHIMS